MVVIKVLAGFRGQDGSFWSERGLPLAKSLVARVHPKQVGEPAVLPTSQLCILTIGPLSQSLSDPSAGSVIKYSQG